MATVNDKSSTDSISQNEEKSTLSAEKVSSKIRESRKANHDGESDLVTISRGELAKLKANYKGEKQFNKKEQGLSSSADTNPDQEYNKALALGCIISLDKEFVNTALEKPLKNTVTNL